MKKILLILGLLVVTTVFALPIKERAGEVISFFIGGVKQVEIVEGGIIIPEGTTAERPTGIDGMMRFNSDTKEFENHKDGAWRDTNDSNTHTFELAEDIDKETLVRLVSDGGTSKLKSVLGFHPKAPFSQFEQNHQFYL